MNPYSWRGYPSLVNQMKHRMDLPNRVVSETLCRLFVSNVDLEIMKRRSDMTNAEREHRWESNCYPRS